LNRSLAGHFTLFSGDDDGKQLKAGKWFPEFWLNNEFIQWSFFLQS
jgi:hypothetical protein